MNFYLIPNLYLKPKPMHAETSYIRTNNDVIKNFKIA